MGRKAAGEGKGWRSRSQPKRRVAPGQDLEFGKIDEIHAPFPGRAQEGKVLPENALRRRRRLPGQNGGRAGRKRLRQDIDLEVAWQESGDILQEIGMEGKDIVEAGEILRRIRHRDQAELFVMPAVEGFAALDPEAPGKAVWLQFLFPVSGKRPGPGKLCVSGFFKNSSGLFIGSNVFLQESSLFPFKKK